MISFNTFSRVTMVARLFRDPEVRTFSNGGKVAKLKVLISNRKKNTDTGEWDDQPVFLDVEVYNRGEFGKDADHVEQRLRNKMVVHIDGRLEMDQWQDQQGQNRSKIKVVAEHITFLDTTPREGGEGGPQPTAVAGGSRSNGPPADDYDRPNSGGGGGGGDEDIPF